jgi:ubiquinone/menaquinone biosynthesis C-methylase UbiE
MSVWGRVFAAVYDRMLSGTERAGLAEKRHALLGRAHGAVVEVGAGTGLNLAHYPNAVDELVLIEPEEPMARRLERRVRASAINASVIRAPAESIPLPDASFDVAVCTLVLCTVRDVGRTLAELRRVLKSDGRLLFLEHVRAEDPNLARWQDRWHPVWIRLGHGCNCNRDTLHSIGAAGFSSFDFVGVTELPKAIGIVRPMIMGSAIR